MKHIEQTINIIFDAGKGNSPTQSREAKCGNAIGELPVPTRSGYSFDGWYLGETLVTPETVVQSDEDMRLTAHWKKRAGTKRNSVLKKQRIAIVCLSALIVALIISLIVINNLISVTRIDDVYYDENGTRLTQTYYVKQVKGVWGMYDRDDVRMEVNEDGYHIALSGNQYYIDSESGECTLYALVDSYDASVGELLGHGARVMMFPQIKQADIYSIVVKNDNETFTIMRHANGQAYLKGTENRLNVLDNEAFAGLAVSCGYTLTIEKLDFKNAETPRTPDGKVDYSAYGLSDEDTPIVYTITKRAYTEDGETVAATGEGSSYTVMVGDVTLAGQGYYAKLADRDAVYILTPSVEETLMQPSESMVTPTMLYPMNVSTYLMVKDFILESGNISLSNAFGFLKGGDFNAANKEHIVDFSYWDLFDRENTMYAIHPFTTNTEMMKGYFLDSNNISNAMSLLQSMSISKCVKNGITEDAIREYLFAGNARGDVYHLAFRYNVLEKDSVLKRYDYESDEEFQARCLEKAKSILSQYVSTSLDKLTYSKAMETLQTMGYYLEDGVLYDKITHLYNIYTFCSGLLSKLGYPVEELSEQTMLDVDLMQTKVNAIIKQLNETDAGVSYDAETGGLYVVNELLISQKTEGKYYVAVSLYDMIIEVEEQHFAFLNWNAKNWYSQYFTWIEVAYMTDLEIVMGDQTYKFRLDNSQSGSNLTDGAKTDKLKVYADAGKGEKLLDYNILNTYISDTGLEKTETITALENFRQYYQILQYISLEGVMDQKELDKLAAADFNGDGVADGLAPEDCTNLPDSMCDLIIYYRAVDLRGNSVAKVIRFYTYSGHTFVTVEVVGAYDEKGNATSDWRGQTDPDEAKGVFYVNSSYLQKLIADTDRVINGEKVTLGDKT